MKNLVEKRNQLIAEYDKIKQTLEAEKRSAYTNEEFEKVNSLKIEIEGLDKQLALEKEMQEKRNAKLDSIALNSPSIHIAKAEDIEERTLNNFKKWANGDNRGIDSDFVSRSGNFVIPSAFFEKRSTVTSAGDSSKLSAHSIRPVSVIEKNLVLQKLGASMEVVSGIVDIPSLVSTPATFGSEDGAITDQTFTSGKKQAIPDYVSASYTLTGRYLKEMTEKQSANILASLENRIYAGIEKRAISRILATPGYSITGVTGTSQISLWRAALKLASNVEYGNAYLLSRDAEEIAKLAKKDSGSGQFVWNDTVNTINGKMAEASSLFPSTNKMIYGDFSMCHMFLYGDVEVKAVQDVFGNKGNFLLVADAWADAQISNELAFAVAHNVDKFGV